MKDNNITNNGQVGYYTLSIVAFNEPGLMAKVSSELTRRGFNIESISAGDTKQDGLYRLTIVIKGDYKSVELIRKRLDQTVGTVSVSLIDESNKIEKEMALIKVKAANGKKSEMIQLIDIYKGNVVDTTPEGLVVMMVGSRQKVDRFLNLLPEQEVVEVARTGTVAMNRWK